MLQAHPGGVWTRLKLFVEHVPRARCSINTVSFDANVTYSAMFRGAHEGFQRPPKLPRATAFMGKERDSSRATAPTPEIYTAATCREMGWGGTGSGSICTRVFRSDLEKQYGVLLSLKQGYDRKASSGHRLAAQAMIAQPQPLHCLSRGEQKEHCGSVH